VASIMCQALASVQRFAATSDDGEETVLTLKFTLEVGPARCCSPSHLTHFETSIVGIHDILSHDY